MAREKLRFLVLDSETATLPFANEIANDNPELKKKIAIAKPLIYDLAWVIAHRDGTIVEKKQFLIAETFAVPSVFNTAYYKEKRPLYLEMIRKGEIAVLPWEAVMREFIADLETVDYVGAFNSMFDFCKALPFTELYINKLYSNDYYDWEKTQRRICSNIVNSLPSRRNPDFDEKSFHFRGREYPLFDIWGMACDRLLNRVAYKNLCLDLGMITNSGDFFKTSAESSYRYLREEYDFDEAHTALADAEIETYILSKILHYGKIEIGIDFFPFRKLGTTTNFLTERKRPKVERIKAVYDVMDNYVGGEATTNYKKQILNKMATLKKLMEEEEGE